MIETGNSYDPLLKRPFSYFRQTEAYIQFLYAVRGKGTALMNTFRKGRVLTVIGPLGSGYPKPRKGYIPVLIAGGIGMASLFPLAEGLSDDTFLIYGARSKGNLLMLDELERLGVKVITCTDDCSFGKEGLVTDILLDFLDARSRLIRSLIFYACGPEPMLKAVAEIAKQRGIKGYVSLEEKMACGFGACLGCAIKTTHGYKRVCKEGPVFPIGEIVW
jgi:dihydroorotate dehydrogenase electron transfer subunit